MFKMLLLLAGSGWDEHIPVYCFPYSFCAVRSYWDEGQSKRRMADDIIYPAEETCATFFCVIIPLDAADDVLA